MKSIVTVLLFSLFTITVAAQLPQADIIKSDEGNIKIQPITHGTLALTFHNLTIYVDPYGNIENYKNLPKPDFILITDIHKDHMNIETLDQLDTENTIIITPKAVADKLPNKYQNNIEVLNNRQGIHRNGIFISAVAMYNYPEKENSFHPKGRGNGYLIHLGNKKIYVSGDTSATPEMRGLFDVDVAFICMNLPYTMDVDEAVSGVLDFEPSIVYPYHYRGTKGLSDIKKFRQKVNFGNSKIEVRLRDWYQ